MSLNLKRTENPINRIEREGINANWTKIENNFNNVIEVVSGEAFDKVVNSAKLIWQPPVNTFADLTTTYPNAEEGWAAWTREVVGGVAKAYRYDGTNWILHQEFAADAINEVDNRLTETINKISIQVASNGTDDTLAIQQAIDSVHSIGSGDVYLPDENYYHSGEIHIKEGVCLKGNGKNNLNLIGAASPIMLYTFSQLRDIKIQVPANYNSHVIEFNNKYIVRRNAPISNKNAVIFVENVVLNTTFNVATSNKQAFRFFSTRSDIAVANFAGFWDVNIRNCTVTSFNKAILMRTELTGFLNGNHFSNVVIDDCENVVVVEKSSQSLGIDYNTFELNIQTTDNTRDIFVDGVSSNEYKNCTIWDLRSYERARVGIGLLHQPITMSSKERYTAILLEQRYHLLGRFSNFANSTQHVYLTLNGFNNYNTHYRISGLSPNIERRQFGNPANDNALKFYTKRIGSTNQYELYIQNTNANEMYVNLFFEGYRNFFPSTNVYYDSVDGLTELTGITDFFAKSDFGEVRSDIPGDAGPNAYRLPFTMRTISSAEAASYGMPGNKAGTLRTYRVSPGLNAGYAFQEYDIFGSTTGERYKRFGTTQDVWRAFYLDTPSLSVTTAERNALTNLRTGTHVYDSSLQMPLWYTGTRWVNANSETV